MHSLEKLTNGYLELIFFNPWQGREVANKWLQSMAEGWYDQASLVDVEVSVRPLKGQCLPPGKASTSTMLTDDQKSRESGSNTRNTTSAVSFAATEKVVYKKENDTPVMNCVWKADSSETYFNKKQAVPPNKVDSASKKGWTKALGPTHKSKKSTGGWQKALSSNPASPSASRLSMGIRRSAASSAASSRTDCRCRCKRKKRKERDDMKNMKEESKSKERAKKSSKEKEDKKPEPKKVEPKKTFFRSPLAAASKSASEVIVEPAPYPTEEKVPYYILWEIKAWAVLLLFWLLLFIYRFYTAL